MTEAYHLCTCGHPRLSHERATSEGPPQCCRMEAIGGCPCTAFTLATAPLPAGCAPDPLDQAAVRVLPDATAAAAEVDSHMVRLSDAKRIRDEAVEVARYCEGTATEGRHHEFVAGLAAHLQDLRDADRDPTSDRSPWVTWAMGFDADDFASLAADVADYLAPADIAAKDAYERGYDDGAIRAIGIISDALGPEELDPVEHISETEEVDR